MEAVEKLVEKFDKVGSIAGEVAAFMGAFGSGWFLVDMFGQGEEALISVYELITQMVNAIGAWWLVLPFALVAGYNHVMYKDLGRVAVATVYVLPVILSCMLGVPWLALENMMLWIPIFALLFALWAMSKVSKILIKLWRYIRQEYAE